MHTQKRPQLTPQETNSPLRIIQKYGKISVTQGNKMKKISIISLLPILCPLIANAADMPWWQRPTVCQLNPTDCYRGMGPGFEPKMWDADSKCWGMKLICPNALNGFYDEPTPVERDAISRGTGIKVDFDTDLLSSDGDCFGRRKTAENGSMASVNGKYVNVWCPGILGNIADVDEVLETGEITYGAQPTCSTLSEYGYAAVANGRCYGKYYDSAKYYIECGNQLLPTRLIVLNGADYMASAGGNPTTESDATDLFNEMYSVSKKQKDKYFNN